MVQESKTSEFDNDRQQFFGSFKISLHQHAMASPMEQENIFSNGYGVPRQITVEEEEEQAVETTKSQIRSTKQDSVTSTRAALQAATTAEQSGLVTLIRIIAQGKKLQNTEQHLDAARAQNEIARERTKELRRLNGSMFRPDVWSPFSASK